MCVCVFTKTDLHSILQHNVIANVYEHFYNVRPTNAEPVWTKESAIYFMDK